MTPDGTFVDDLLVYRLAPTTSCWSSTPSNIAKDFAWIAEHVNAGVGDAVAVDSSSRYALIAVQGPAAREVLQPLTGVDLGAIKYYWFAHGEVAGVRGDDLAHRLHRRGRLRDLRAAGQAGARLGRACSNAGEHVDREAGGPRRARHAAPRSGDAPLRQRHRRDDDGARGRTSGGSSRGRRATSSAGRRSSAQKAAGVSRKLVGFEMIDRAIARHGSSRHRRRRPRPASSPAARRRRS